MQARDVMSQDVTAVAATASITEAARALVNAQATAMPVKDAGGALVGIVSEADVIAILGFAQSSKSGESPVSDIMTRQIVSADENASITDVAKTMLERKIKRLPITRGGQLVGMLRRSDLLKALLTSTSKNVRDAGLGSRAATELETPSDNDLRRRVEEALVGGPFSTPWAPEIVAIGGTVHLWGRVPSQRILDGYLEVAGRVPGVSSVITHMHILAPGRG